MNKLYRGAALAAILVSLSDLVSLAVAQGPARPPVGQPMVGQPMAGQTIALLDVTYIFKNHNRFKALMEQMKASVQRAESDVKAEQARIAKIAEDAKSYKPGTPEYKIADEQITNATATLNVKVQRQKKEFFQEEAKIYNSVYQEITQATDYYCKQHGIDLVLKFNGDPVDVDQPESVLAYINKPVVWYRDRLDITPAIRDDLNRAPVNPGPASRPGVQLPPR